MSTSDEYEKCRECGEILKTDGPCPRCQSTERVRVKPAECAITATSSLRAEGALVIGWQEVDRLFSEKEYAAALLVAAVNVEFILWEKLRRLSPTSPPVKKTHFSEWRAWEAIGKDDRDSVGLGSLIQLAQFFVDRNRLALSPPLKPFAWPLNEARKGIAHERGYFAKLTQLNDADWPETRIRRVLKDAKEFCHRNAP